MTNTKSPMIVVPTQVVIQANFQVDQFGNPIAVDGGTVDNLGNVIYPDNYAQNFTYNSDTTLATIYFTDGVHTWTQTFTYSSGQVSNISVWVRS